MNRTKNVLLLRGLSREVGHWFDFPEKLASLEHVGKVICLDLPGFGTERERESPKNIKDIMLDVRSRWSLVKEAGVPAIAAGQSLGGMVLLKWAEVFPEDFEHFVLINTSTADESPPWKRLNMSVLYKSPISLVGGIEVEERVILNEISNVAKNNPETLKKWVQLRKRKPFTYRNVIRQLFAASKFLTPKKINAPLLFLVSRNDRLVDYNCSVGLSEKYNSKIIINEVAGHDMPLDDPEWVIERFRELLIETS